MPTIKVENKTSLRYSEKNKLINSGKEKRETIKKFLTFRLICNMLLMILKLTKKEIILASSNDNGIKKS